MIKKTTRKARVSTVVFEKGERVSVLVPKIDRQGLQCSRLPGIITRVMANGYFELMTSGGTIYRKFRSNEMSKYSGTITITSISTDMISLRAASIFFNNDQRNAKIGNSKNKSAGVSCRCKIGSCVKDKRCKCSVSGNKGSSHCHKDSRKNCD